MFYYLHSHWLCSTNGSSMSSCFMKEVLISCTQIRKYSNVISLSPAFIIYTVAGKDLECVYLHGECVCEQGNTLQGLVSTAATTPPHRHAGRDEEMVRLPRQLPPNLHQSVPRLTATPRINLQPPPHW